MHCFGPSLGGCWCTDGEDVFGLVSDFFEDVFVFLVEEVTHLFYSVWLAEGVLSIISSVMSDRKSSMFKLNK